MLNGSFHVSSWAAPCFSHRLDVGAKLEFEIGSESMEGIIQMANS